MQDIHVRRYSNPKATGWAGWIEPEDRSWIAFIDLAGAPRFFLNRDPATGAVLPDDPAERGPGINVEGGVLPPLVLPDGARLDGDTPLARDEHGTILECGAVGQAPDGVSLPPEPMRSP